MSGNKSFHSEPGEAFYSDAITVVFGKGRFVLDFKKSAPRIDHVGGKQNQTMITEHQPVLIQPEAAKMLLKILENNVERYEDKYGEIEIPEKKKASTNSSTDDHGYIG